MFENCGSSFAAEQFADIKLGAKVQKPYPACMIRRVPYKEEFYYGTIQCHRHELRSLQRPCGKGVSKVPGVTSCSVSLLTNSMGVEGTATASAIISAVEQAGYGCSSKSQSSQKESVSDAEKAWKITKPQS